MHAKDLMIGDWVKFPIGNDKVVDLPYIEGRGICASFAASATLFPVEIDKIEPIPLTPEILEKNGFIYEKTHDVWIAEWDEIIIEVGIYHPDFINIGYKYITPDGTNDGNISSICKVDGSDIMTHELQHALRLCGIEKEIEL